VPAVSGPQSNRLGLAWLAAGVLALIAGLALWAPWRAHRTSAVPVARLTMELAPAERLGPTRYYSRPNFTAMAFSPDGNTLVFSGVQGSGVSEQTQLYRRALNQIVAVAIPGTDGAAVPFFSPDGQWVGFFAGGKLKKVPIDGGPAVAICDVPDLLGFGGSWGGSWSPTDNIVFAVSGGRALMQVPAAGGASQPLAKSDAKEQFARYATPHFLPDGKTLLFTRRSSDNWDDAEIVARRLDTGEQHTLVKGGADPRYVPTGHLVYIQNATLMAVPFDAQRVQVNGPPVAILDGVMQSSNMSNGVIESGMGQYAISDSGTLLYASGGIYPMASGFLFRVDRKGVATQLNAPKGAYFVVRTSPDGKSLAVAKAANTNRLTDIWLVDINSGNSTRLTTQQGSNMWPIWSADGKQILFSGGLGNNELLSVAADGSGSVETVVSNTAETRAASLSPDGKWLASIEGR
jgi:serine/threonine-protein kinase